MNAKFFSWRKKKHYIISINNTNKSRAKIIFQKELCFVNISYIIFLFVFLAIIVFTTLIYAFITV
jgi:hypothetical protein